MSTTDKKNFTDRSFTGSVARHAAFSVEISGAVASSVAGSAREEAEVGASPAECFRCFVSPSGLVQLGIQFTSINNVKTR